MSSIKIVNYYIVISRWLQTSLKGLITNATMEANKFSMIDYVVFSAIMISCLLIGIYFGFIKTAKNASDYLVGQRKMTAFPVAMSLLVR